MVKFDVYLKQSQLDALRIRANALETDVAKEIRAAIDVYLGKTPVVDVVWNPSDKIYEITTDIPLVGA